MKCNLVLHLAAVAGLVRGRAVASNMDGAGILGTEHFRMALLQPRQSVSNLQVFGGALGNVAASAITKTEEIDRPFGVDGSTFVCFRLWPGGYLLTFGGVCRETSTRRPTARATISSTSARRLRIGRGGRLRWGIVISRTVSGLGGGLMVGGRLMVREDLMLMM